MNNIMMPSLLLDSPQKRVPASQSGPSQAALSGRFQETRQEIQSPHNDVLFSGNHTGKSNLGKWLRAAVLAIPLAMSSGLLGAIPALARGGSRSADDIPAEMVVNSPSDVPWVNQQMQTRIVDVAGSPLSSPEAYRAAERILDQCYLENERDGSCGQMKIVIVPSSRQGDAETMARDFNNAMRLGKAGVNDGVAIYINKDRLVANASGRYGYDSGDGIKNFFRRDESKIRQAVGSRVMSLVAQAAATGNSQEAQRLRDQALIETARIFTDELREVKAEMKAEQARVEQERIEAEKYEAWLKTPEGQKYLQERAEKRNKLIMIFLVLLTLAGAGTGVAVKVSRENEKKRRMAGVLNAVTTPLIQMGSSHKVTPNNIYTLNTLAALLNVKSGSKTNASDLAKAIETVLEGLSPENFEESYEILMAKGLVHPHAEIRRRSIIRLASDGVDREEFEAFMTLIKGETDDSVIDALDDLLLQASEAGDAERFKHPDYLKSGEPGIRSLSVAVLDKYPNASTIDTFFELLGSEVNEGVVNKLQDGIVKLAKADTKGSKNTLLLKGIEPAQPAQVKAAAIGAMGQKGEHQFFSPLLDAFCGNEEKGLNTLYVNALGATVEPQDADVLYSALRSLGTTERYEKMVLDVLGQPNMKSRKSIKPLFDYLQRPDTRLPNEATALLVSLITAEDRDLLLKIFDSYDPKTEDKEVMAAAAQGLAKINNPEDLPKYAGVLKGEPSPHLQKVLLDAMENSPHNEVSFAYLCDQLENSTDANVRNAAALTLDDYGLKALTPLMKALRATTAATPVGEVDVLERTIQKVAKDESGINLYLEYALESNAKVSDIAAQVVVDHIDRWDAKFDYDDTQYMNNLVALSKQANQTIADKAVQTYRSEVQKKAAAVERLGQSGDFQSGKNYTYLEQLSRNTAIEAVIRDAAKTAHQRLKRRRSDHEAEQRRIAEQRRREAEEAARRAARRAAEARRSSSYSSSSSSSSSSYSSGGWGGGGGFSSGGGGGGW